MGHGSVAHLLDIGREDDSFEPSSSLQLSLVISLEYSVPEAQVDTLGDDGDSVTEPDNKVFKRDNWRELGG